MIITRTPFRISFAGGGTDINTYYKVKDYGAVVSATINKYMYITINRRFDDTIRISYANTEIVESVDEIKHDIVRECLQMVGIKKGIEITSIADIPAGTGLGSSSSFTVGLLNALYTYIGKQRSAHELAVKACEIEINRLKEPIGKQDQFAAAYGGLNYYRFNKDESVEYEAIRLSALDLAKINNKLMMFYTGVTRNARDILDNQKRKTPSSLDRLNCMKNQAEIFKKDLLFRGVTDNLGNILHEGWLQKKLISDGISNSYIDKIYENAKAAGAVGGKILGAGGGGFLLLYCNEEKQEIVREAIGLKEIDFRITNHGSRVVYIGED